MELFLRGNDLPLQILREQFQASKVTTREYSGTGFFTRFETDKHARRIEKNISFKLGDVEAEIEGLKHGAGFLLYIERGALYMLEGYSYDEEWPTNFNYFRVAYTGGADRDIVSLREKWSTTDCPVQPSKTPPLIPPT